MIRSFIFSDGKLVGQDLELEALRLVRADKGLLLWVDLDNPTPEEIKAILETTFQFHPLAIEDCVAPSSLPKVEDYEDYLFIVTHAVDFTRTEKFNTTELDFFQIQHNAVGARICRKIIQRLRQTGDGLITQSHHAGQTKMDVFCPID